MRAAQIITVPSFPQITEFRLESSQNLPGLSLACFYFGRNYLFQVCFRYSCGLRSSWPFAWLESLGFKWFQVVSRKPGLTEPGKFGKQLLHCIFSLEGQNMAKPSIKQSCRTGTKQVSSLALRRYSHAVQALLSMEWKLACANRACFAPENCKKHTFG